MKSDGLEIQSEQSWEADRSGPMAYLIIGRRKKRGKISQLRRMFSPRSPGIPSKLWPQLHVTGLKPTARESRPPQPSDDCRATAHDVPE